MFIQLFKIFIFFTHPNFLNFLLHFWCYIPLHRENRSAHLSEVKLISLFGSHCISSHLWDLFSCLKGTKVWSFPKWNCLLPKLSILVNGSSIHIVIQARNLDNPSFLPPFYTFFAKLCSLCILNIYICFPYSSLHYSAA